MPEPTGFTGSKTGLGPESAPEQPSLGAGFPSPGAADSGGESLRLTESGADTRLPGRSPLSGISDLSGAAAELASPDFEIVDLSQRYDIQGKIGAGGMGDVYRGHDRKMNRPVAIKRLKSKYNDNTKLLRRFVDEARTVSHSHIVLVYDFGRDKDGPFLILEFIDGESLEEKLARGPMELKETLRLLIPICEAVSFAHKHNVIHRDIKPANILVSSLGIAKLGDFGIATPASSEDRLTQAGSSMGTPGYMSPEQASDSATVDGRSDLFSLACTFFAAVTGRSPQYFDAALLPSEIRDIVVRARQFKVEDRQPSVDDFIAELRNAIAVDRPVQQGGELADGQCRSCLTINRADRKYCKKTDCGAPLYEPCPVCQNSSPVWEPVCGECGTNIPAVWGKLEADINAKSQHIEAMAGEYQYPEAERLLAEITALQGPKWQDWRNWAEDFSRSMQAEKGQQEELREQLFREARKEFDAADYDEVDALLQQIPRPLQNPQIQELSRQSQARKSELNELLKDLRRMAQSNQRQGLRAKINRVLELSPNDPRVAQLDKQLKQLEERRRLELLAAQNQPIQIDENDLVKPDHRRAAAPTAPQGSGRGLTQSEDKAKKEHDNQTLEAEAAEIAKADGRALKATEVVLPRLTKPQPAEKVVKKTATISPSTVKESQEDPTTEPPQKLNLFLKIGIGVCLVLGGIIVIGSMHQPQIPVVAASSAKSKPSEIESSTSLLAPLSKEVALVPGATKTTRIGNIDVTLCWCPPGKFKMGSPPNEKGRDVDERQIDVEIVEGFWMGETEVTQELYESVMGNNPSYTKGKNLPVEQVTWTEAKQFCDKMTQTERLSGRLPAGLRYDLPTAAQWEYACRAGTQTTFSFGNDEKELRQYAWYGVSNVLKTHEVKTLKPNPWGLFDMHGNVNEWCEVTEISGGRPIQNIMKDSSKVAFRGGSFLLSSPSYCRSAAFSITEPNLKINMVGIRLVQVRDNSGGPRF